MIERHQSLVDDPRSDPQHVPNQIKDGSDLDGKLHEFCMPLQMTKIIRGVLCDPREGPPAVLPMPVPSLSEVATALSTLQSSLLSGQATHR